MSYTDMKRKPLLFAALGLALAPLGTAQDLVPKAAPQTSPRRLWTSSRTKPR